MLQKVYDQNYKNRKSKAIEDGFAPSTHTGGIATHYEHGKRLVIVEYTKEQHLYRILVPSAHILLTFCIRIGTFDRSRVFGRVEVFRIIIIGIRVQRTDIGYCG